MSIPSFKPFNTLTMFDFLKSCIEIVCGNYIKTIINVPLKQQPCGGASGIGNKIMAHTQEWW